MNWQDITNKVYSIKYNIKSLYERIASVIRYAKFIWNDYNWIETDYTPFISLMRFKLENMREFIDYNNLTEEESTKMDEQITESLGYLYAWQALVDVEELTCVGDCINLQKEKQNYKELFFKSLSDNIENWWS